MQKNQWMLKLHGSKKHALEFSTIGIGVMAPNQTELFNRDFKTKPLLPKYVDVKKSDLPITMP